MREPLIASIHTVKLDDTLRVQLRDLAEVVTVCDEAGNRVGHFVPVSCPLEILEGLRKCPFSEAELEERRKDKGGRTLDEILKSLGQTA
jgi:hypothetical protein